MKAISMWLNKKDPQCLFKLASVILCGNIVQKTVEVAFAGCSTCKSLCGLKCRSDYYSCFNYLRITPHRITEFLRFLVC